MLFEADYKQHQIFVLEGFPAIKGRMNDFPVLYYIMFYSYVMLGPNPNRLGLGFLEPIKLQS